MRIGKLIVVSASAVGLGIFLGAVPLAGGQTAAELLADWMDRSGREGVQQAKRVAFKSPSAGGEASSRGNSGRGTSSPPADAASVSTAAVAAPPANAAPTSGESAPITAEAANSPEQTSASDKAALDRLISKKTK